MSPWKYLSDQKYFIFSYILLMLFITLTVIFDPGFKIHISNVIYLLGTSLFIIFLYLFADYFSKRSFLLSIISETPKPKTYEQRIIVDTVKNTDYEYRKNIEKMHEERKEQLEYMTSWFHEIKTPIAVSRLLLETDVQSDSLSEEMDKIEQFVEQALYFSRLNDFHQDFLVQEIDLEKLIKGLIKAHAKTFIAKKISINLQLSKLSVLSDMKAISYIMNQLLSNALINTPNNGKIDITINAKERRITVQDNGIGIPPEDLPRVLEKGFTGKNGRQFARSTGMGLYMANRMSIKLGHTLSISSNYRKSTTVTMHFPKQEDFLHNILNDKSKPII